MRYEIIDSDALGRIGKLEYNKYEMITPNLIPVVHPYENIINPKEIKKIGFDCIFTNAYILYQNIEKRLEVLQEGLRKYFNFPGLIATDSGAFQQYMYNEENIQITPREIEKFQEDIGSDFPVILDVPVQPDDDYNQARKKMKLSLARAKSNIRRRKKECCWIGPIHGAQYSNLLEISSKEMSNLNFSIYAIGGLVKFFLNYRFKEILEILLTVKKNIIPNKPLHMFGLGLPQLFSIAVACGCDLMDSAAYILYAKENRYFTLTTGTERLGELKEFPCNCPICSNYTPSEIMKLKPIKRTELLAKHNLYLSHSELKNIRQAIYEGNLWELIEERIRSHPNLFNTIGIIRKNLSFFEIYEKIYKNSGRLLSSLESLQRPIIARYTKRLKKQYRVPKGVKFLIILPELDIKGENSPSVNKWLNQINNNKKIPRKQIHIVFYSGFFGIIPLELIQTYPMGQHESINLNLINDLGLDYAEDLVNFIKRFINNHLEYEKVAILNPEKFINQFGEEKEFMDTRYENIFKKLPRKNEVPIQEFQNIKSIFEFFNRK